MHKVANVGLVGFGTVGGGLCRVLEENRELIRRRTDVDILLKMICDLDTRKVRDNAPGIPVTDDWKAVLDNPEIDTVVELIGGLEPAKTIIMESLRRGRNVVTANKKLLAEKGGDIFELAHRSGAKLGFEAAVGGGIPCIQALRSGLVANRVLSVMGILNGTTNYILTRMSEEGLSFEKALSDAQAKGFAEADPTFDIGGFDAGHKIAILSMLAYNTKIDYSSIPIEGITRISDLDIAYAKEMGYVIKLLGISKFIDGGVDIRVHPTMLPLRHPLAAVRNEFNAVMFAGDMTGPVTLYGRGAGATPTASAVVSDITAITLKTGVRESALRTFGDARYALPENRLSRYYMRVHTEDRPGILSKISGALAEHEISIASVIQKESAGPSPGTAADRPSGHVPLVIVTHEAVESGALNAVKEINSFGFVEGGVTLIRIEDYLADGESHG